MAAAAVAIETVATATTAQVPTQETRVATQDGMNDATIVAAETEEEMVVVVVCVRVRWARACVRGGGRSSLASVQAMVVVATASVVELSRLGILHE